MAEMLLINPRRRRKSAKKARRSSTGAKRRRVSRRRNPIPATTVATVRRRRRNPIRASRVTRRRRRNPIGGGAITSNKIMAMVKDALIGGAGAVAVDIAMGQIAAYLPASLRRVPGTVGVGDAVKAGLTVALGQLLAKPTKGLSRKLAAGALTVQTAEILRTFVPAGMTLGYANPALVAPGTMRVGPSYRPGSQVGMYARGGTPLLSGVGEYVRGGSPLLSGNSRGRMSAREREGVIVR
jgi:hypothetical protein